MADVTARDDIHAFIKDFDIREENGELAPVNPHRFLPTYVRYMRRRGVCILAIKEQLQHVSLAMTSHYHHDDPELMNAIMQGADVNTEEHSKTFNAAKSWRRGTSHGKKANSFV